MLLLSSALSLSKSHSTDGTVTWQSQSTSVPVLSECGLDLLQGNDTCAFADPTNPAVSSLCTPALSYLDPSRFRGLALELLLQLSTLPTVGHVFTGGHHLREALTSLTYDFVPILPVLRLKFDGGNLSIRYVRSDEFSQGFGSGFVCVVWPVLFVKCPLNLG